MSSTDADDDGILSTFIRYYSSLKYLRERDVLIVSLTGLLDQMSVYIIIALFPIYINEMGISGLVFGLIFAANPFASAVLKTPFGYLADRFDRKNLIVGGTVISGLSIAALAVATSPTMLIFLRLVDGGATAMRGPASRAYIGDRFPDEERGRAMGAKQTVQLTGTAFGPALGGIVASMYSLAAPFLLLGGLTVVGGLVAKPLLQSNPRESGDEEETDETPSIRELSREQLGQIVTLAVVSLSLTSFVSAVSISAFQPLFSVLLEEALQLGVGYIGFVWGAFGISMLVFVPIGGTLADESGRKYGMIFSRVLWGIIFVSLPFVPVLVDLPLLSGRHLVLLLMGIGGFASAIGGPAMGALTYETAPSGMEGTIIGFYGTLGSVGGVVGPLVGGLLMGYVGVQLTILAIGVVVFLDSLNIFVGITETVDGTAESSGAADDAEEVPADA